MTNELEQARQLLDAGDIPGTVRALRPLAETAPLRDLAEVVRRLSSAAGFDDLAKAAKRLAKKPENPQALYDFGYGCVERGVSFLAVPALRQALRHVPESSALRVELVSALERDHRHTEAVAVLTEHEAELRPWPEGYLLVFNSLLAGDLSRARDAAARLPAPDDDQWEWAHDRVRSMLRRAALAATAGPLDGRDLRGWHYTLTGGYLGALSPYGFAAGMTGRYAYLQDTVEQCRAGLDRLASALDTTGLKPRTVSLLPGRAHHILGLAAAEVLGLPAEPYAPGRTDTVVVAYDLGALDDEVAVTLRERVDGQVLYEHATRWTDPPLANADMSALLCQFVVEPWGPKLRHGENGTEEVPADTRSEAELAAEIVRADPAPDPGDGETPPDPDEAFAAFVAVTADGWLTGTRIRLGSPGPVGSSRFD
ncbi:hypothetical protein AB0I22_20975 [Streptomyces sp. NPDC050610]|uniref:hypothetical protein n=1 Tax=Streptomyces sp. NPDC050610 TaxID=3157097 RepID=UPI0034358B60